MCCAVVAVCCCCCVSRESERVGDPPHRYHKIFSYFSYLVSVLLLANLACVLTEIGFWPSQRALDAHVQLATDINCPYFWHHFEFMRPCLNHTHNKHTHTHTTNNTPHTIEFSMQLSVATCATCNALLNSQRYWVSLGQYSSYLASISSQWVIRRSYR